MVVPLRDIQPRQSFPIVTIGLLIVNVLFFLYELSLGERLQGFLQQAAFVPERYFAEGGVAAEARPILVSMFLHGGWMHLIGNMLYLWIFGDNVEDQLGHLRFLVFYLACGWLATMAHAYMNTGSAVPSIGASGAIAGVLGAYLLMFPRARVLTLLPLGFYMRVAELPALVVLGFWFVLQLFNGVAALGVRSAQTTGVAVWAHVGGFMVGMILCLILRGRRRPRAWSARR